MIVMMMTKLTRNQTIYLRRGNQTLLRQTATGKDVLRSLIVRMILLRYVLLDSIIFVLEHGIPVSNFLYYHIMFIDRK